MRTSALSLLIALGLSSLSFGAITIEIQVGELLDASSNLVSEGSIWAIIYDADGDGFLPGGLTYDSRLQSSNAGAAFAAFSGASITTGTTIGNDRILWAGIVDGENASGAEGVGGVTFDNFTFASLEVAANGRWGVFWFPELTDSERTLGTTAFQIGGIQINSADTLAGGQIGMFFPAADDTGASLLAYFYNESFGGSTPDSYFTAINAIPEPTSALVGLLVTAGLLRRRRGRAADAA